MSSTAQIPSAVTSAVNLTASLAMHIYAEQLGWLHTQRRSVATGVAPLVCGPDGWKKLLTTD